MYYQPNQPTMSEYHDFIYFQFFPHVGNKKHISYITGQKGDIVRFEEFDIKLKSQANVCLIQEQNKTYYVVFHLHTINIIYANEEEDVYKCGTIESDDLLVSMFRFCFDLDRVPYQDHLKEFSIKIETKSKIIQQDDETNETNETNKSNIFTRLMKKFY